MTLEEALIKIETLERELELAKQKGTRIIEKDFVEGPVSLLNIPVPFADYAKEDGSYYTILEKCEITTQEPIYNHDKTRFIFGYELSWEDDVYSSLEQYLVSMYGKQRRNKDYSLCGEQYFSILSYTERNRFMSENPDWIQNAVVE